MNVKDLLMNDELMDNIVEDIEDIPEDSEVTYEVWALGYADEDDCTNDEVLLGEFTDPDEAVKYAEKVTLNTIKELGYVEADPDTTHFSIEVETVVEDPEDEGTMNLGSVYSRDLWLDGEYGSEEDVPEIEEPFVPVLSADCKLIDDGILKIRCDLLKNYNKNDLVNLYFIDEPDTSILTYKIISKVTYVDGDYYHCDLLI